MNSAKLKRSLDERFRRAYEKTRKALAKRAFAVREIRQERKAVKRTRKEITATETAQQIFQNIAKTVQESVHKNIAGMVSRCLRTIFETSAYEFQIRFERKRGKTEAQLVFLRDGIVFDDPPEQCSGGQVQVAAFALRLACLLMARPKRRKLIVLDEPFLGIDQNNAEKIKLLLEGLAKDLKIQIIMVTHNPELVAGKVIQL